MILIICAIMSLASNILIMQINAILSFMELIVITVMYSIAVELLIMFSGQSSKESVDSCSRPVGSSNCKLLIYVI